MIIIDLFDIDIHIFTVIKFLFNLGVRFNYIPNARNERTNITNIYSHSININNYVPNDCESLPIDIDEIATRGKRE